MEPPLPHSTSLSWGSLTRLRAFAPDDSPLEFDDPGVTMTPFLADRLDEGVLIASDCWQ